LGEAFLGKGILREYSGIGRGADKKICQMAAKARQNHGSAFMTLLIYYDFENLPKLDLNKNSMLLLPFWKKSPNF